MLYQLFLWGLKILLILILVFLCWQVVWGQLLQFRVNIDVYEEGLLFLLSLGSLIVAGGLLVGRGLSDAELFHLVANSPFGNL